jgi:hypothetical protein
VKGIHGRAKMVGRLSLELMRPAARIAVWQGNRQLQRFQQGLRECRSIQDRVRNTFLRVHRESEFGRRHGFAALRSYADFTRAVPAAHFAYYTPYIERCKAGDRGALLGPAEKLLLFATTSGTTETPKYVPITARFMAAYRQGWNLWIMKYLADHPHAYWRKVLQVSNSCVAETTTGGIPCGSISTALARHQRRMIRCFYATPSDVASIPDAPSRHYVTMRLALMEDVGTIVTANPSTLVVLAQTVARDPLRLIRDIRDGGIDKTIELPTELRGRLTRPLRPDPGHSRKLEQLLERFGRLLPRDCWHPAGLAHWTGGTVGLYLPEVRRHYGDHPVRDIGLLATEGRMSIPLQDNTPAGVLDIFANFYEFVPEEELASLPPNARATTLPDGLTVLRADELTIGGQYFVLLTNSAGLYRYHIGDLVRVTDRLGSTPVIEFLSRGAHTSSVTGEKLTEHQVVTAVGEVLREEGDEVTTFTLAPVWAEPPYYLLLLESRLARGSDALVPLAERIDRKLGQLNVEYQSKRQSQRLGALRIRQQAEGAMGRTGSTYHEQYKHRFLLNQPIQPQPGPAGDTI